MLSRRLGRAFIALVTFATAALWIAPTAASAAGGLYVFQPLLNPSKCIDDPNGSIANSVQIIIYSCNSGVNQDWQWFRSSNVANGWDMKNRESSKCLTVSGAKKVDNTPVIQYDCTDVANEVWVLGDSPILGTPTGDYYTLRPSNALGECLTLQNGSTDNNTKLIIFQCNGGHNQFWTWS